MDPASIIGIVAASAALARFLTETSLSLEDFVSTARDIDFSIEAVKSEISGVLRSLQIVALVVNDSRLSSMPGDGIVYKNACQGLATSLHDCEDVTNRFSRCLQEVRGGNSARNLLGTYFRKIKFRVKAVEIQNFRFQIQSHNTNIQTALHVIQLVTSLGASEAVIAGVVQSLAPWQRNQERLIDQLRRAQQTPGNHQDILDRDSMNLLRTAEHLQQSATSALSSTALTMSAPNSNNSASAASPSAHARSNRTTTRSRFSSSTLSAMPTLSTGSSTLHPGSSTNSECLRDPSPTESPASIAGNLSNPSAAAIRDGLMSGYGQPLNPQRRFRIQEWVSSGPRSAAARSGNLAATFEPNHNMQSHEAAELRGLGYITSGSSPKPSRLTRGIFWVAKLGSEKHLRVLLAAGADINTKDVPSEFRYQPSDGKNTSLRSHFTPLHYATLSGRIEMVQALLSDGAHLNSRDENGLTPLHWVLERGLRLDVAIFQCLLGAGPDINAQANVTYDSWTALHFAIYHGASRETVQELISAGADVNAKSSVVEHTAVHNKKSSKIDREMYIHGYESSLSGSTPLTLALKPQDCKSRRDIVRLLLSSGADTQLRTASGDSVLHLAARHMSPQHDLEMFKSLIVPHGADPNAMVYGGDHGGKTPLHVAAQFAGSGAVGVLIEAHARHNSRTHLGMTPLYFAARRGFRAATWEKLGRLDHGLAEAKEVINMLIAAGADSEHLDDHDARLDMSHFPRRIKLVGDRRRSIDEGANEPR